MRRTTHTRTIALAALALLLAGCGTQGGGDAGTGGTVSPSPPGSTTSPPGGTVSPSPSSPSRPDCAAPDADLGAADTGRTYCLAPGETIRVLLDGTTARPWKPVETDGSGLEATNSGVVLRPGDASAAYRAVSPGTVRLTSSRPSCPSDPARLSCDGPQKWSVTVVVPEA
ncbi:hypothetical protein [Streptomyces sp. NPDC058751]|uniref:hypothetical protein n=1 Tax=Streptomyces sp. NPDC058751 TaxID=3346623 RepID=UPI00368D08F5